ncbi:MAG: hypothetical protein EOO61_03265 [Hymenobacter sp.]|nr:MAG: hypothetical protein EOO61_03265 [Hymenobacter sp.]
MAYVIIYDRGYGGYSYNEFNSFDELLENYALQEPSDIAEIYEIKRDVSRVELEHAITQRKTARDAAIATARAKLTPEECELLGIV